MRYSVHGLNTPANLEVTSYSWSSPGGPDEAKISVWGDEYALWDIANQLSASIEILNEYGEAVWWGYINTVDVRWGAVTVGVDLETMNNRVAALYIKPPGADAPITSSWIANDASVAKFGAKEMLMSLGVSASEKAEASRNRQLRERGWPTPKLTHEPKSSGRSATITGRGWYTTMGWKYYTYLAGQEKYDYEGLGTQWFGDAASSMRVRGSFRLQEGVDAFPARLIQLKMRKANSPCSNVLVELKSPSNTLLMSGSVSPCDMGPNHAWIDVPLTGSVLISPSTDYWIEVSACPVADPNNYYVVNINEELSYPRGQFWVWTDTAFDYHTAGAGLGMGGPETTPGSAIAASTWFTRSPDADMEFKISGSTETSEQAKLCASRAGQFFSGVDLRVRSLVFDVPYEDGTRLAKDVMGGLLEAGTSNERRLALTVGRARVAVIDEEPAPETVAGYLWPDGRVTNYIDETLGPEKIVGHWIMLRGVYAPTFNQTRSIDPTRFFITKATYNVQDDTVRLETRERAERLAIIKGG